MLTAEMQRIIAENTIGLVATVDPEGYPAVSPKGTMLVLDDRTIAFSDIRSPQTARNIRQRGAVEINFFDPFRRKAVRMRGKAKYHEKGSSHFEQLAPRFQAKWETLFPRMRGLVVVDIERAQIVLSPVYDDGAVESDLRTQWLAAYTRLHGK